MIDLNAINQPLQQVYPMMMAATALLAAEGCLKHPRPTCEQAALATDTLKDALELMERVGARVRDIENLRARTGRLGHAPPPRVVLTLLADSRRLWADIFEVSAAPFLGSGRVG